MVSLKEYKHENEYICKQCNYKTESFGNFDKHLKTKSHLGTKIYKKYKCDKCDFVTTKTTDYEIHCLHNHTTLEEQKVKFNFFCEKCHFGTMSETSYEKHLGTQKHERKNY
jgi:hypothetical protein